MSNIRCDSPAKVHSPCESVSDSGRLRYDGPGRLVGGIQRGREVLVERSPVRQAGAAHLRLRTDSDWLLDIVRFVAASRHARTRGTTR